MVVLMPNRAEVVLKSTSSPFPHVLRRNAVPVVSPVLVPVSSTGTPQAHSREVVLESHRVQLEDYIYRRNP
jgi:hypothetical protein